MNQSEERKMVRPKLWKLIYSDHQASIYLTTYADTIVFDNDGNKKILAAIRFGGYAEHVRGMADAIYGGGTVKLETENEVVEFQSLAKQYRRNVANDDIYTEATLLIADDRIEAENSQSDSESKKEQTQASDMLRTSYIFCEQNNTERLFEEIDKKVSVPLISDFKDYIVSEMQKRNILKKLTVFSFKEKFDAWKIMLNKNEQNVTSIIEDGLKSGAISIPSSVTDNPFSDIKTVSGYLNAFGVTIAEKIKGQFNPLFDPSTETLSKEVMAINSNIRKKAGYGLYDAQLATAESLKRRLDTSKFGLCVAECGSGKTKIGSTALRAHQMGKNQPKTFNIVLCPSHLSKKWVREIEESLPDTFAIHIKSITELHKVYDAYQKDKKSCYIIITKEKARDGYMKRPSVKWNKRRGAFLCPNCYKPIMMDVIDDGAKYKVEADQFFFQKENSKNHKCENCGHVLWTVLVSDQQSEWVKISNYGFIHREKAARHYYKIRNKVITAHEKREKHLKAEEAAESVCAPNDDTEMEQSEENDISGASNNNELPLSDASDNDELSLKGIKIKFPKTYYDIKAVVDNPDGRFTAVGAYNRFPLSTYIKKKMRGKIDGLIIDELQDYNNDSGQGDAMNELFGCAKKVVGLTGTLINGYSHGIFYLLYRVAPHLMQIDDKKYTGTKEFNDEYGVTESVYEVLDADYNSNRRTIRKKIREKQLPGVSPLVYSRFLIESAVFLSLNDMGKQLPEYEEIPITMNMEPEIATEYERLEKVFIDVLKNEKKIAKKVMSAFMRLLTFFPDQPYDMKTIINPITGATLVKPGNKSSFDSLNEKDMWLLEKVKEKIEQGGRVIVYTSWVSIDTQEKLLKLLKKHNVKAEALTAAVAPNKREEWVEKRVKDGIQVLITNPALVETGLDLNDFATLVYYNIGYKLFTLRQSSRRSWRINQKAPRVEVYFLYFKDVMQSRAIRLMASKLAVAGIIEGNFSDEGLAAMSDCQDLTTLLVQELTLGIKNEVEDLGEVFKKMAILKSENEAEPEQADEDEQPEQQYNEPAQTKTIQIVHVTTAAINETSVKEARSVEIEGNFLSAVKATVTQTKNTAKKKALHIDPNQLSLFDFDYNVASA